VSADDEMHAAMMHASHGTERAAVAAVRDETAELAAAAAAAAAVGNEADGEWETVGKRGSSSGGGVVTQIISRSTTPLALIFAGSLATSVHRQGARGACSFSPFWFLAVDFAPDAAQHGHMTQGVSSAAALLPALHLEELLSQSFKKNAVDTGDVSVSHVLQQLPKVRVARRSMSHVTRHTSHSHVTHHTSQVLLLHVKRFALRDDKIVKISQPLQVAPLLQVVLHTVQNCHTFEENCHTSEENCHTFRCCR
jgi:hypothetical protein